MFLRMRKNVFALCLFFISAFSYADDIDLINQETPVNSNILFVMDLSGSMNYGLNTDTDALPGQTTRLQALSGAFQDIVGDPAFDEINFGLSVFSGGAQGNKGASVAHGITYPVAPVIGDAQTILNKTGFVHPSTSYMPDAGTHDTRAYLSLLSADTNIWSSYGSTPIVDALYEAALYFRGSNVFAGRYLPDDIRSAHPATYNGSLVLTTTPASTSCAVGDRVWCSKGSCGVTESCTSSASTFTSNTDLGSCTVNTGNRQNCWGGSTSCGSGTNCVPQTNIVDRYCNSSITSVSDCLAANPTWENCTTYPNTIGDTNSEGQTTYRTVTNVRCKETINYYQCDAADTYTCPTTVENCTRCPDDSKTEITGTAVYKSPIVDKCSSNGIILLSDGAPTENNTADNVASMIGSYTNSCNAKPTDDYGRCGPELAEFLSNTDHADGSTSLPDFDDIQNVRTFTVGLSLADGSDAAKYLSDIAAKGQGDFVNTTSRAELVEAFKQAVNSVSGRSRSFSSPSYTVNTSTLLSHGGFAYVPVFDRDGRVWPGNLKKYKLENGKLIDANGNAAVDSAGVLLNEAKDYWATADSTNSITSGGAANKINPSARMSGKMLTDNGVSLISLANADINDFGLANTETAQKAELIKYISGVNPSDDSVRNHMGDIIHSRPVQLQLTGGRKIVFIGSNEGFLHAINDYDDLANTNSGTEAFAYMPQELLKNIKDQYGSHVLSSHIYGVDSEITLWIDDSANSNLNQRNNGVLESANGEKAYLFFGLRRGGQHYYAINITDPDSPVLLWKKQMDANTWSQPVVSGLKWSPNTKNKPVLVFGGGFNDDSSGAETAGGKGVYILDAISGDLVWSTAKAFAENNVTNFSGASMPNAVPSRIRTLDLNRDGSIDRLYFGDTGGNIWRVDLNASLYNTITTDDSDIDEAILHLFAKLGGSGANNRKFFEEPDVAVFKKGGSLIASIAIGSGDRPNPLDSTVDDNFFVLFDKELMIEPKSPEITKSSGSGLYSVSAIASDSTITTKPNYKGWYKDLTNSNGEKVLATAVTYENRVFFTTFGTSSVVTDSCGPSNVNEARLYGVDLFTGDDVIAQTASIVTPADPTDPDSKDTITLCPTCGSGEIFDTPQIIFEELKSASGGKCVVGDCVRTAKIKVGRQDALEIPPLGSPSGTAVGQPSPNTLQRVYWIDNEQ